MMTSRTVAAGRSGARVPRVSPLHSIGFKVTIKRSKSWKILLKRKVKVSTGASSEVNVVEVKVGRSHLRRRVTIPKLHPGR